MTAATPTVSIVMPCYNAAVHLPASVGCVCAQTFTDWELIAVDDGSTDGTAAWLQSQTDPRLHVCLQTNQGVSAARNAGLALAKGRYVAFLDADDTWAPSFLEKMVAALKARPEAALAYCGWQNLGLPGGRGEPFVPPEYETPNKVEKLFAGCRWPIHGALTHRTAIEAAGGFDPRLKHAEDYALWLEIAAKEPIVRVPEVLAYYHFHGTGQVSSDRGEAAFQLFMARQDLLMRQPEFLASLPAGKIRQIQFGGLLSQGYEAYWKRDLPAARRIFREVMKHGYGSLKDWTHMLPALFPLSLHQWLIERLDHSASLRQKKPRKP